MAFGESAAVAKFEIAKETAITKAIEKETWVERRKEPLLGIRSHTSCVRHPGRTSRAEHIKPIQLRGLELFFRKKTSAGLLLEGDSKAMVPEEGVEPTRY